MSALRIVNKNPHNQRFLKHDNCEGGCTPHNRERKHNTAIRVAYILGRPAAGLCAGCAKAWEKTWAGAA